MDKSFQNSTVSWMIVDLWNMSDSSSNKTNGSGFTKTTNLEDRRGLPEVLCIGLALTLVILFTIGGNLLVCIVIRTNRKLRTCTNYFIASLATADLLLGCLVLPFSVVQTLDPHWPFGAIFCNVYTSSDVMLCTVSILTLFAISLDRYFAVTLPLRYTQKMNGKIVLLVCSGIWTFSAVMAFLPILLGWNTPSGLIQNWDDPERCVFMLNKPYVLLVSLGTYFAPLVIMCGVYLKVLQITRAQVREINKLSRVSGSLATDPLHPSPSSVTLEARASVPQLISYSGSQETLQVNGVKLRSNTRNRHRDSKLVSDTKATVTLASVILAFAICWIPYFTIFTIKPFLEVEINLHVDLFVLWLGYVNSAINPFLYAFYNSAFREGFRNILCRHCDRRRRLGQLKGQHIPIRSPSSEANAFHLAVTDQSLHDVRLMTSPAFHSPT